MDESIEVVKANEEDDCSDKVASTTRDVPTLIMEMQIGILCTCSSLPSDKSPQTWKSSAFPVSPNTISTLGIKVELNAI